MNQSNKKSRYSGAERRLLLREVTALAAARTPRIDPLAKTQCHRGAQNRWGTERRPQRVVRRGQKVRERWSSASCPLTMTVRSTAERVGYKRLTSADIVSKCIYLAVRRWLGCRRCPNADESVEADSQGTGVETRERSTVWGKCGDGPLVALEPHVTCLVLSSCSVLVEWWTLGRFILGSIWLYLRLHATSEKRKMQIVEPSATYLSVLSLVHGQ